jgi:hypothetical protein
MDNFFLFLVLIFYYIVFSEIIDVVIKNGNSIISINNRIGAIEKNHTYLRYENNTI